MGCSGLFVLCLRRSVCRWLYLLDCSRTYGLRRLLSLLVDRSPLLIVRLFVSLAAWRRSCQRGIRMLSRSLRCRRGAEVVVRVPRSCPRLWLLVRKMVIWKRVRIGCDDLMTWDLVSSVIAFNQRLVSRPSWIHIWYILF